VGRRTQDSARRRERKGASGMSDITLPEVNVTASRLPPAPSAGATDDITISVNGKQYGGWAGIQRVTRGIERTPSTFALHASELYPGGSGIVVKLGDACQIKIGNDIVLTGYVDRYEAAIDQFRHEVHIIGRGKCADLVDCSAFASNRQFINSSIRDVAEAVAKPFGVSVVEMSGGKKVIPGVTRTTAQGAVIPQLNVGYQDTAWDIIETSVRWAGLLAYENELGNVVLSDVGAQTHASGFKEGVNVQRGHVSFGIDQRYSEYHGLRLGVDTIYNLESGIAMSPQNNWSVQPDAQVNRFRPFAFVVEQGAGGADYAEKRVVFEAARRLGRSQAVMLTVDSWRDSAGKLWTPNMLAMLDIPSLRLPGVTWLITEVSFIADRQRGTVADITLMPKEAFMVQLPQPSAGMPWQEIAAGNYDVGPVVPGGGTLGHI